MFPSRKSRVRNPKHELHDYLKHVNSSLKLSNILEFTNPRSLTRVPAETSVSQNRNNSHKLGKDTSEDSYTCQIDKDKMKQELQQGTRH